MELFADTTPRTAENFRALCTGEKGIGKSGKPLYYKGSRIHFVSRKLMLCGGDIIVGDGPGVLSMANGGPDTNDSRFMICMQKCFPLDDVHVVFGQVVEGIDVVESIMEDVVTYNGKPSKTVVIADCGQIS
ncbi:peptidyl-prolyl cis-trans isomerase CYP19-1-like [Arabidopsis lyrata subsp. lyrata]|nr:peptidyl-prolyl cis-trans isomerase CYP19-1-like [Arabidopsis lyrata subsp. lyrata]|eukprot:XP_020886124.1 peptidyl-prolyl cis-trans isomerase CYP19-1-like [Arabidopsis lyrata subsp. lyrata]